MKIICKFCKLPIGTWGETWRHVREEHHVEYEAIYKWLEECYTMEVLKRMIEMDGEI